MNNPLYWKDPKKQIAREIAMDYSSNSNYAGIFLPGLDNACVNYALKNKTISKDKPLYLIEKDRCIAEKIRQYAKANLLEPYLHIGEADKLKINKTIDFAYFDFIGSMNEPLYDWFKNEIIPNLHKNNRLTFCFNYAWRPRIPFLESKVKQYLKNKNFIKLCKRYYDHNICTYLMLFKELLPDHRIVSHEGTPFYYYCSNKNSVVVYTFLKEENDMSAVKKLPCRDCATLVEGYPAAYASLSTDRNKWRGWVRSFTLYCRNRASETGRPTSGFRNAVLAVLSKNGYDITPLKKGVSHDRS